jgi:hypothetical protein
LFLIRLKQKNPNRFSNGSGHEINHCRQTALVPDSSKTPLQVLKPAGGKLVLKSRRKKKAPKTKNPKPLV